MKNTYKMLIICASLCLSMPQAHADGVNATGDQLPIGAGGNTVLTINSNLSSSFAGPVTFNGILTAPLGANVNNNIFLNPNGSLSLTGSATVGGNIGLGTVASNGWGTSTILVNGNSQVQSWDAHYDSVDSITGKTFELIGTYNGWDPNSIYIAGYNATNTAGGFANATSISFGGYGSGNAGWPVTSPTAFVDLVNKEVGINTTSPQATLDIENDTGNATVIQNGRQTYQTAGIYTINMDGSCRYGNPLAGNGCACPAGYTAHQIYDFVNGNCSNGYYSDNVRSSNCGIEQFQCL